MNQLAASKAAECSACWVNNGLKWKCFPNLALQFSWHNDKTLFSSINISFRDCLPVLGGHKVVWCQPDFFPLCIFSPLPLGKFMPVSGICPLPSFCDRMKAQNTLQIYFRNVFYQHIVSLLCLKGLPIVFSDISPLSALTSCAIFCPSSAWAFLIISLHWTSSSVICPLSLSTWCFIPHASFHDSVPFVPPGQPLILRMGKAEIMIGGSDSRSAHPHLAFSPD